MTTKILGLLERMTSEEQAEVETFAAFVIARRELQKLHILTDDISNQELLGLVEDSGSFDWLDSEKEDIYSINDGEESEWANAS